MTMHRWCTGLMAVASLCIVSGASSTTPDATTTARAPFERLRLSAELAREAVENQDPILLLAAARLRRSVAVTPGEQPDDRIERWIGQAERMGGEDPRIASIAADVRAMMPKGREAGPRVSARLVRAGQKQSFVEHFRVGRPAVVYVEGDGDSDLSLGVGSASGVACSDTGPGDVKICAWMPRASEPVRVEVTNVGAVENRFILGTN